MIMSDHRAADFKRAYTPLHFAAEKGDLECLEMLLNCEEVDVDAKDLKGDTTPLLLAVKEKHEEAAKILIQNGASLNINVGRSTLKEQFSKNFPEKLSRRERESNQALVMNQSLVRCSNHSAIPPLHCLI